MGGTKIFVLQMKEIIKTGIFAIIGILLIVLLIYLFVPRDKKQMDQDPSSMYIPGTYTSEIILHNSPVDVQVTVTDKKIVAVDLKNMAETQEVFYPLFQPEMKTLAQEIVKYQSAAISPSAENPFTGQILLDAVNHALAKASVTPTPAATATPQ